MAGERLGAILLAGGVGSRMQNPLPKQFLPLNGKLIAQHSLDLISSFKEVDELIIVCAPEYQNYFTCPAGIQIHFALSGNRRQDSVYNGLQALSADIHFVCIHDAARPYLTLPLLEAIYEAARLHGAACAGVPLKFTVKEVDSMKRVIKTPDRAVLWEIQTPQVIRTDLLHSGFDLVHKRNLTVTDDVSLVELLGEPVQIVEGCYRNIKITTPEDLL